MQNSMAKRFSVIFMLCAATAPAFAWQREAAPSKPAASADAQKADTPKTDAPPAEGKPQQRRRGGGDDAEAKPEHKPEKTVYDYSLAGADGKDLPMSTFKGKIVLLVNLGRNSSYNDQLQGLIKISEKYKDKGFVVIGVPSNDFGAAEPGTDVDIQKVYKTDDKVPFLVTAKSVLTGDEALPLYGFLTKGSGPAEGAAGAERPAAGGGGGGGGRGGGAAAGGGSATGVHWNYTKFLIDRTGKVTRFEPDVAPDSSEMLSTLDTMFMGGVGGGGGRSRTRPDQTAKSTDDGDAGKAKTDDVAKPKAN